MPLPVTSSVLSASAPVDKENANPNVRQITTAKPKSSNPLDWLSEAQREIDEEQALKAQKKYDAEHERLMALRRDEELAREMAKQFETKAAIAQAREKEDAEIARQIAAKLAEEDAKVLKKQAAKAASIAEADMKLAKKLQNEEKKIAELESKKLQKERESLWRDSRIDVKNDGTRVNFWISLPHLDNANVNFEHDETGAAQLNITAKPVKEMDASGMEQEFGIALLLSKQDGLKEFDLKEEDIEVDYNDKTGLLNIWCAKVKLAAMAAPAGSGSMQKKSGGWIRKLKAVLLKK